MKRFSVLSVAAALLFSANAFATEGKPDTKEPEVKVSAEIGDLLRSNRIELEGDEEINAFVRFTLNNEGQLVVLSVRTDSPSIESFVKAKLNYQEVKTSGLQQGKTYEVPIRFTS